MADDKSTQPTEVFSIVILGAHNPRIHHPLWYQLSDIISETDAKYAIEHDLVCLPEAAHFEIPGFSFTCTQDRWDVATQDISKRLSLLDFASKVFDEKLPETPVSLFAFNNDFLRNVSEPNAEQYLVKRIAPENIGFRSERLKSAEVIVRISGDDNGITNVRIAPSPQSPAHILVAINSNHPLKANKMTRFSLRETMHKYFQADFEAAEGYVTEFLGSLAHQEK